MSDAEKERIKLKATFYNNLAVASAAVGILAPAITLSFDIIVASESADPFARLGFTIVSPGTLVIAVLIPVYICLALRIFGRPDNPETGRRAVVSHRVSTA